jgi:hypothetical protein
MKQILICVLVMAMITGGACFVVAQTPGAGEAAKKEGATKSAEQGSTRELYGKIQSIKGTMFTLQTRSGALVQVDAKPAVTAERSVILLVGHAISVKGTVDKAGVLHAEILQKAKDSPTIWPADR